MSSTVSIVLSTIELIITTAQKNKVWNSYILSLYIVWYLMSSQATEYHLGLLKAKLARYRAELLEPTSKSGGAGTGFDVQKSGDARVALIGFPSVGKVGIHLFFRLTTTKSILSLLFLTK